MSAIGKIRQRSTLLVAIVGLALAAFVLGDLVKGMGTSAEIASIGEVYGEPISEEQMRAYNDRITQTTQDYINQGVEINAQTLRNIRDTEWNRLMREIILGKQLELLGIQVTNDELTEIIHGADTSRIHRFIKSDPTFKDSTTGVFNPRLVTQFIQRIEQEGTPEFKQRWENFIRIVKADRAYTKYYKLIEKGLYVTNFEAQKNYETSASTRSIKFVVKKYNDIGDSLVNADDDAIYAYYQEHKNDPQYEQKPGRLVEYVRIEMEFSEDDIEKTKSLLEGKKNRFTRTKDDSLFVVANSSSKFFNNNYVIRKGMLDAETEEKVFYGDTSVLGTIVGPFREGNTFKIAKITGFDTIPERSVRHILISFDGAKSQAESSRTKEEAKRLADSLENIVRNDTSAFTGLVTAFSEDQGSVMNGGKYMWFPEGQMVATFNDFSFQQPVGAIGTVETEYGYHIIEVLGARDLAAKAIPVEAEIRALEGTIKSYREKAIEFISAANTKKTSLKELSGEFQYPVQEYEVGEREFMIPNVQNSNEMISWLKTAMKGDISNPIVSGNSILVARLVKIKTEGVPDFEDVKEMMRFPTMKHLKAELYRDKMTGNSLDEVANRVGERILNADIRFSDFTIPGGGGNEPEVIGAVFANYSDGDIIGPIEGRVGIYTVLLQQTNNAPAAEDLTMTKRSMTASLRSGVEVQIYQALEKIANVVDNRD